MKQAMKNKNPFDLNEYSKQLNYPILEMEEPAQTERTSLTERSSFD